MNEVGEHPTPTVATVKVLYAHAFRCAHPQCARPLYKLDDESGEYTLNSHVAHIHARSSGGPRWIEMTDEDNRAPDNLVLLCLEHAHEIDVHPDRFPAELLREWKAAQLAEHHEVLKSWPLTDAEAEAARYASFYQGAQALVDAATLAELARAVEAALTLTRRAREGPRAQAQRAAQLWAQTRGSSISWDSQTGERLYASPPPMDQHRHREALLHTLRDAGVVATGAADRVRGEVAALQRAVPDAGSWCDWVRRALDDLEAASRSWPGELPVADDDRVERAGAELARAARALDERVRDLPTEEPPVSPALEEPPESREHPDQAHRDLLETARPFSRIDTLPFDPDLRERLVVASTYASTLPPIATNLPFGLEASAAAAADVAANSSPETLHEMVDADRRRRPVCVAVLLVRELAVVATTRGCGDVADAALAALAELFGEVNWDDEQEWADSEVYGGVMFGWFAAATASEVVRERLAAAARSSPRVAACVLRSAAAWVMRREPLRSDLDGLAVRTYRGGQPWLPAAELIEVLAPLAAPPARQGEREGDRLLRELTEAYAGLPPTGPAPNPAAGSN